MGYTKEHVEAKVKFINSDYYDQPVTAKVFIKHGSGVISSNPESWILSVFKGDVHITLGPVETHGEALAFLRGIEAMLKEERD